MQVEVIDHSYFEVAAQWRDGREKRTKLSLKLYSFIVLTPTPFPLDLWILFFLLPFFPPFLSFPFLSCAVISFYSLDPQGFLVQAY